MTPAERARIIDKEEFAAECAAVRQRAHNYVELRRHEARCEIANWLGREAPKQTFRSYPNVRPSLSENFRRPAKMWLAFGKEQSLAEWAKEYGILAGTIRTRLKHGWTLENALRVPPAQMGKRVHRHKPGVVSNLSALTGTGAGGTAQEMPNITFSGNEACQQ